MSENIANPPPSSAAGHMIWRGVALLLLIAAQYPLTVAAQAPERQQAFVYGINAALGTNFVGNFAPPSVDTIYLLADQTNIISPRMTEIYFWPITNEYQASWETLNQPVTGTLEILGNGRVIQETSPTSYTIQYKPRGSEADATLFLGDEARAAQDTFAARQLAQRDASAKYLEQQQSWLAAVEDANRKRAAGENVTVPPEPEPPAQIDIFSNGLNTGMPVKLPAGNYRIQLRQPDGTVLPGSERNLVTFAPRRTAIGYTVLPETRWTTPEELDNLHDVIVGRSNSQIYLVPHVTREYPARFYALVQDPQREVSQNAEWTWVAGEPITTGDLEIVDGKQGSERRQLTPYRVKQAADAQLGYEVQPFAPSEAGAAPDFTAYPLRLAQPGNTNTIRIVSSTGEALPGSQRLVRVPTSPALSTLLVLSAVPLVVGAAIIVRRRRRVRLPRNIAG